jgi:hypothetical protein
MLIGFILGVTVTLGAIAGGLYWAYKRAEPGITLPW